MKKASTKKTEKVFPNGFRSWMETHYEIVSSITIAISGDKKLPKKLAEIQEKEGTTGFYDLAAKLTDEFEQKNKGREWDGGFFDEIEEFVFANLR